MLPVHNLQQLFIESNDTGDISKTASNSVHTSTVTGSSSGCFIVTNRTHYIPQLPIYWDPILYHLLVALVCYVVEPHRLQGLVDSIQVGLESVEIVRYVFDVGSDLSAIF